MKMSWNVKLMLGMMGLLLWSCNRQNSESGYVEFYDEFEPTVTIDSSYNNFLKMGDMSVPLTIGEGYIKSPGIDKQFFFDVRVTVKDSESPYLLAWEVDEIKPGEYEGSLFSINLANGATLNGGKDWTGTSFTVTLESSGAVGEIITGSFKGYGTLSMSGQGDLLPFEGTFNVERVE